MVGWVVLSESFWDRDIASVRQALDAAFPRHFLPARDQGCFVVDGPTKGQFFVRSIVPEATGLFMVMIVPGPYLSPQTAAAVQDAALRQRALAHRAWLSVDMIGEPDEGSQPGKFVGPALVSLAPADATLLVHATEGVVLPYDDGARARLAAGLSPLQAENG